MKRQPVAALVRELLREVAPIPVPARELAALIFPDESTDLTKFRIHSAVQYLRERDGRQAVETAPDHAGYRVRA